MGKKIVKIMDTSFRDGFQSVFGARVLPRDFLPAVEAARDAGIKHFEAGGGALFQSLYFYCNEDAFAAMDAFRQAAGPDADLQTLARGINVVGLDSQSSDIIQLHAQLFKKHGVTTIRNFDALNDVRNLIYSGKSIVEAGLKHEVTVTMMALPPGCEGAHDAEFYVKVLRDILDADIPFHTVCFKDASGTSTPETVYQTIKQSRALLSRGIEICFHTHETAGTSILAYKAALEAGADIINLAMAPVSGGTSQPDIITMWHALRGTDYHLDVDIERVMEAEEIFKECMKDYFMPPEALAVDPLIIFSPMPGGALTANTQMMRDSNILDRYPEVIKAMSEVVMRGGFGTSVTPVSQFYFQQAFNNVMFGHWKTIADGYGRMVLGYFGRTPVSPDPEIVAIAAEQLGLEPTTADPLEINDADSQKGVKAALSMLKEHGLPETDENVFIVATCKDKGISFLKGEGRIGVRKRDDAAASNVEKGAGGYTVTVNEKDYAVVLNGNKALVNGKSYDISVRAGADVADNTPDNADALQQASDIKAPLPGAIIGIKVNIGDKVESGMTLLLMEAMKMETEIKAPLTGEVASIAVSVGDQVSTGQVLVSIN
ncbi:MAG: biotin/lipoyl-binding protein [bacterium]|jgi:pyruvate carboxylase subunit B|nr:biotin/lipoyl-binding protein [bacterium]MDD4153028.1 biotin/lipoyl-binding protein [bacterium]MDD4557909.1 biotin/lipoyl-binding protein [bacterium]